MNDWKLTESFDFDGREVRYSIVGDGPPMVMVHGTPWSSFNLRHLIGALSADYRVHYFDLMGYGQSCRDAGDVSLGMQNRLLDRLLDHWRLDAPIAVGHDFGGTTVLRTHLLDGRDFDRMVLIDPVAVSPWGSPFFRHVNAHEAAFAGMPGYIHEAVVRRYVQTAAFKPLDDDTLEGIVQPWRGDPGQSAFYRQMAQADSRFTDEIQTRYSGIDTPTLILWGREDRWVSIEQGEKLKEMIPGSRLRVIDDAGHLVIEEQPGALVREIRDFAGKRARSSRAERLGSS